MTGHLTGVKIAIMGCIVNGPGEMADADFGYVGGAPGKVNLYVGKECVEKNVPQAEADDRLIALIKCPRPLDRTRRVGARAELPQPSLGDGSGVRDASSTAYWLLSRHLVCDSTNSATSAIGRLLSSMAVWLSPMSPGIVAGDVVLLPESCQS